MEEIGHMVINTLSGFEADIHTTYKHKQEKNFQIFWDLMT